MAATLLTADTSVVVPAIVSWHEAHQRALAAIREVRQLPAHVFAEAFSVLTRLPGGHSLRPAQALEALGRAFPHDSLTLSSIELRNAVDRLAAAGLGGGRVSDAVVAATAMAAGARLRTSDRRAISTYELLGLDYELIG